MATVKKIPAAALPCAEQSRRKIRVAAYARVSTEHDEQDGSYEAQVKYFNDMICANPEWQLVEIFADRGISGTCVTGREEFQRMIRSALAGNIDLILTKSISRFARNTVTTLETIRQLRAVGTTVRFEKECLDTSSQQGELMLTILSALAEQESRSISENIQWGIKAKFKEGRDVHNFYRFLGYGKGWEIIEEDAETVRLIYALYLSGLSMRAICRELEKQGRHRQDGGSQWHTGSVSYILNNPAYCGDILLQKTFTVDFRGRVRKKNQGEVPMYFVEDHHPGILSRHTYERVQLEIKRRRGRTPADFSVSPFFGSVTAAPLPDALPENAPLLYHRITIHGNVDRWKKAIWKPVGTHIPAGFYPTFSEDEMYHIFGIALISLSLHACEVREAIAAAAETASVRIPEIQVDRSRRLSALHTLLNAIAAQSDSEQYEALVKEYNTALTEYEILGDKQWRLEQQIQSGSRLLQLLPEIQEALCTSISPCSSRLPDPQSASPSTPPNPEPSGRLSPVSSAVDPDHASLSAFYLRSGASMTVFPGHVAVSFGAGITQTVAITKSGRSWSALSAM